MRLQNKFEELEAKIWKIKNQKIYQNLSNIEGEKIDPEDENNTLDHYRFSCCHFEVRNIKELREEKDKIQEKINEIYNTTKNNTFEYFGGCAFVTFDSISEKEFFLSNLPQNAISYIIKFIRNIIYIFLSCCKNKSSDDLYYLRLHI